MTEQQLGVYLAHAIKAANTATLGSPIIQAEYAEDVSALVGEVQRLQGILKEKGIDYEHCASGQPSQQSN